MINIIKAKERHYNDYGWLKTYWLFSFSNYYDPQNVGHGSIRVFNDDVVQPQSGFDIHPHEEMEIISIILDGAMVHQDNMGNKVTLVAGDVQRMTAGSGLYHSEWNRSKLPVSFFQIWLLPSQKGLPPSYEQKNFQPDNWDDRLTLFASDKHVHNIVTLNTDAEIYRARVNEGFVERYTSLPDRSLLIYVISGGVVINELTARKRDQVRISGETEISISSREYAEFILIDVPESM